MDTSPDPRNSLVPAPSVSHAAPIAAGIIRSVVITALLAATGLGIGYADACPPARGIVESVREVQLADPFGFSGVFEHAFKPPTADELLVRLDDARAITVVHTGMRIFEAAQRVHVVPDPKGVRIEHADDHTFFQP